MDPEWGCDTYPMIVHTQYVQLLNFKNLSSMYRYVRETSLVKPQPTPR